MSNWFSGNGAGGGPGTKHSDKKLIEEIEVKKENQMETKIEKNNE